MDTIRIGLHFALSLFILTLLSSKVTAIEPIWTDNEDSTIYSSDLSDDGKISVIGQLDYDVNIYANSSIEKERRLADTPVYETDGTDLKMVAISGNGKIIGVAGETLQIYHNNSENQIWEFDSGDVVYSISINYDGDVIVTGNDAGKIQLFNSTGGEPLWTYNSGGRINAIAVSDDGEYIIAGRNSGNLYFFHRSSNSPLWSYNDGGGISSVGISTDGSKIVVTNTNKKLYSFNKNSNTPNWIYEAGEQLDSVAISSNGEHIVSGGGDNKLRLHNFDNSNPVWIYETGGWILDVDISKNGQYVVAGGIDSKFYCFNVKSNNTLWTHDVSSAIQTVSISANGNYVMGGGYGKDVYYFISPLNPLSYITQSPQGIVIKEDPLYFEGGAEDESNITLYKWNSSIDGIISDQNSFSISTLSSGSHTIEFNAIYSNGNLSEPSFVFFIVNSRPASSIVSIDPLNSNYGETVSFVASADDSDGDIEISEWRSSKDGLISNELSFSTNQLSEGGHNISFRAKDNLGTWSEYSNQTIHIYRTVIPNATILSVNPNPAQYGENVTLSGEGNDEDGIIIGYRWISSLDGELGNYSLLETNLLSPGLHTITFSVIDNSSAWSNTKEITLIINSKPSITDITVDRNEVFRPGILEISVDGIDYDGLDNEGQLEVEMRHDETQFWENIDQKTILYDDDPLENVIWSKQIEFATDATTGNYLFRARLTDSYSINGDWFYLNGDVVVYNSLPVVSQLSILTTNAFRGQSFNGMMIGADENTPLLEINPEIQATNDGSNWSSEYIADILFFEGKYIFNFTTDKNAIVGEYWIRGRFTDHENGTGNWVVSSNLSVFNNPPSTIGLHSSFSEIGRGQELSMEIEVMDFEDNVSSLIAIVKYKSPQDILWQSEHITSINSSTDGKIYFLFTPNTNAFFGSYSFQVYLLDSYGESSSPVNYNNIVSVVNSKPVIKNIIVPEMNETFKNDEILTFEVVGEDLDGEILSYRWTSNLDGIISNNAKFNIKASDLTSGQHTIILQLKDDLGEWSEQESFEVTISNEIAIEEASFFEKHSNSITLLGDLTATLLILTVIGYYYRKQYLSDLDGGEIKTIVLDELNKREIIEWEKPHELPGAFRERIDDAWFGIIIEMIKVRRESYLNYPDNEKEIDFLHNNRERFTISSYFEVPVNPKQVLHQWALPENLKGNIYLDDARKKIVDEVINSHLNKNYVIIGEPGIGKTVLLFDIFDKLTDKLPSGILTTNSLGNIHQIIGMRLLYDDIPENLDLLNEIVERKLLGIIVTSREADWEALPSEFQNHFERITVPSFSSREMKNLCISVLDSWNLEYEEEAINHLVNNAEGSPIYVWSLVKEMLHKDKRHLTLDYLKRNSTKGLLNYVSMFLQRLLKEKEEYRKGSLHILTLLSFLSNSLFEKECHDVYFDKFSKALNKHTNDVFDDELDEKLLSKALVYLSGEGNLIRFPHDTWVDILQGQGKFNPFKTELRKIQADFIDNGLFKEIQAEVISDVWGAVHKRYDENPISNRDSIITLIETLLNNFSVSELDDFGLDLEIMRKIGVLYSHLPAAAKLVSKIDATKSVKNENIINIQNSMMSASEMGANAISHPPYIIEELYIIYKDGRLINSILSKDAKVDSDIMSSMLTAINDFVKDSFETTKDIGTLKYGENQIIMERGEHCVLAAVIYGETTRELRSRMANTLMDIEQSHNNELQNWNGDLDVLSNSKLFIQEIMKSTEHVSKLMIDSFLTFKDINMEVSFNECDGFLKVKFKIINYSNLDLYNVNLALDYSSQKMIIAAVSPKYEFNSEEINIDKLRKHSENSIDIYFDVIDSNNLHLESQFMYKKEDKHSYPIKKNVFSKINWKENNLKKDIKEIMLEDKPKFENKQHDKEEIIIDDKVDDKFEDLKKLLDEIGGND